MVMPKKIPELTYSHLCYKKKQKLFEGIAVKITNRQPGTALLKTIKYKYKYSIQKYIYYTYIKLTV